MLIRLGSRNPGPNFIYAHVFGVNLCPRVLMMKVSMSRGTSDVVLIMMNLPSNDSALRGQIKFN